VRAFAWALLVLQRPYGKCSWTGKSAHDRVRVGGGSQLEVGVLVVERNFAEFSSEFACDYFGKRHEQSARVGSHGEAVSEGSGAISSAHPGPEDEGVGTVESDDWLDGDWRRRVRHEIFGEIPYLARQLSVFWTGNLPRGVPEVDEYGLAEIGNSKEETRGTQFRQVRAARCVIPYVHL
jgi:hypothetical protein